MPYLILLTTGLLLALSPAEAKRKNVKKREIVAYHDCTGKVCGRLIKRHLFRDVKYCQLPPQSLENLPDRLKKNLKKKVKGRTLYLSIIPGKYSYQGKVDDAGVLNIYAHVYFRNHKKLSPSSLDGMREKLREAAYIWTRHNPYGFPIRFHFPLVKKRKQGDVRPKLRPTYSRGPYFYQWSEAWSSVTVAHEMGHVLGLDDEYSNTGGVIKSYCTKDSLMCSSSRGIPKAYHYYLFLRRLLC